MLSYADMGANLIFNELKGKENLLLAEGVSVFTVPVPLSLVGLTLAKSSVPSQTGCSIVAIDRDGRRDINLKPDTLLPENGMITLIGSVEAEEKFLAKYASQTATL